MSEKKIPEHTKSVEVLEKQNEKLKESLKELTLTLNAIKDRQKVSKLPESYASTEKQPLQKLEKLKNDIARMKKELEGYHNINKITDLENQSTYLSKRIEELETEKKKLLKLEKKHQKALDTAFTADTYPEKIRKLKEEVRKNRETIKELNAKLKQDEKAVKIQHEKCVDLEDKCRKLYEMIKSKKKEEEESKKPKEDTEINEFLLKNLEEKLRKTEDAKQEEELKMKNSIKDLETQIREGKNNLEMLKIKYKEKEQESRLCLLKIRELRKLTKHNQLRPLKRSSANSTPKNRNFTPVIESEVKDKILEMDEGKEYNRRIKRIDSGVQKLFHQETIKIVERMKELQKFDSGNLSPKEKSN